MSTNNPYGYTGDRPAQHLRRQQNDINNTANAGHGPGQRNDVLRRHLNDPGQNGAGNDNHNAAPDVEPQNNQGQNRAGKFDWQRFTQLAAKAALTASMPLDLWLYNWAHNKDGSINKGKAFVAAALIDENRRNQQNMQQVPETNVVMDYAKKLMEEKDEPEKKVIEKEEDPDEDQGYYSS